LDDRGLPPPFESPAPAPARTSRGQTGRGFGSLSADEPSPSHLFDPMEELAGRLKTFWLDVRLHGGVG
jgi:hypothetical protein